MPCVSLSGKCHSMQACVPSARPVRKWMCAGCAVSLVQWARASRHSMSLCAFMAAELGTNRPCAPPVWKVPVPSAGADGKCA
eukprot:12096113-Alexandrium_andersonii.AAC.1